MSLIVDALTEPLDKRIKELEAEVQSLNNTADSRADYALMLLKKTEGQDKRIKEVEEALGYYADEYNWENGNEMFPNFYDVLVTPAWEITGWTQEDWDKSDISVVDSKEVCGRRARVTLGIEK